MKLRWLVFSNKSAQEISDRSRISRKKIAALLLLGHRCGIARDLIRQAASGRRTQLENTGHAPRLWGIDAHESTSSSGDAARAISLRTRVANDLDAFIARRPGEFASDLAGQYGRDRLRPVVARSRFGDGSSDSGALDWPQYQPGRTLRPQRDARTPRNS